MQLSNVWVSNVYGSTIGLSFETSTVAFVSHFVKARKSLVAANLAHGLVAL